MSPWVMSIRLQITFSRFSAHVLPAYQIKYVVNWCMMFRYRLETTLVLSFRYRCALHTLFLLYNGSYRDYLNSLPRFNFSSFILLWILFIKNIRLQDIRLLHLSCLLILHLMFLFFFNCVCLAIVNWVETSYYVNVKLLSCYVLFASTSISWP